MQREICVCCGKPLEGQPGKLGLVYYADDRTVSRNGASVRLAGQRAVIFDGLLSSYPAVRQYWAIYEDLYGDRAEQISAERVRNRLSTKVSRLRHEIEQLGIEIEHTNGLGYRLVARRLAS